MDAETGVPEGYVPKLHGMTKQVAITRTREYFQEQIMKRLNLIRVSAPLVLKAGTGINDDLNGVERPVGFTLSDGTEVQIPHSLAKWKRVQLGKLDFPHGRGLWTNMNAIRKDEVLTHMHSVYCDQWDWERVISREERSLGFLKGIVREIYAGIRETSTMLFHEFGIGHRLPAEITFITSEELEERYPGLGRKEREDAIAKEHGAVFIIGVGHPLSDGKPHDGRAPDYDDWVTPNSDGGRGLNGDIIVWNPVLGKAFELSSMGIRVDRESLLKQLEMTGKEGRKELAFHRMLLRDELPLTIGGGIGQSRLCMFMLKAAHIGEVQESVWTDDVLESTKGSNIPLL